MREGKSDGMPQGLDRERARERARAGEGEREGKSGRGREREGKSGGTPQGGWWRPGEEHPGGPRSRPAP